MQSNRDDNNYQSSGGFHLADVCGARTLLSRALQLPSFLSVSVQRRAPPLSQLWPHTGQKDTPRLTVEMEEARTSTAQDEKVRFRLSALGQQLTGLNNPVVALQQLQQKRRQYLDITRRTAEAHRQSILELCTSLQQQVRLERMPVIKSSPKKKRKARTVRPDLTPPVTQLSVYWRLLEEDSWRPETREGAAMATVGEKVYLYGGASRSIYSDLWVLHSLYPRWVKTQPAGLPAESRMGHSLLPHQGSLITFGGVTAYNRGAQHRECLNSVKLLRTDGLQWCLVEPTGVLVSMRRYHCAAIVGKHMLVHGGLNEKNAFLNDAAVLNLKGMKWKTVEVQGAGPGYIAFHTAVAVYPPDVVSSPDLSLFRLPETQDFNFPQTGIYVFGGLDVNSQAHNQLYLCRTGQRPIAWSIVKTEGTPPSPRFQHTLSYVRDMRLLVVIGGRNDTQSGSGYTCFNDVHLLNLVTLLWTPVIVRGEVPKVRCAHAAAAVGNQVVVFGGVEGGRYCSSDTYILELDPKTVQECVVEDRRRQQRQTEEMLNKRRLESRTQSAHNSTQSRPLHTGSQDFSH